jgi:hypothetical protein
MAGDPNQFYRQLDDTCYFSSSVWLSSLMPVSSYNGLHFIG